MTNLRKILKFYRILPAKYLAGWCFTGLLTALLFALQVYGPLVQKKFVDKAILMKTIHNEWFEILIIIYSLTILLSLLTNLMSGFLSAKVNKIFIFKYLNKVMHLKKTEILKRGSSFYYDIISGDTEVIVSVIMSMTLFSFIFSIIQSIFVLYIIYHWNKVIFGALLGFIIIISVNTYLTSFFMKNVYHGIRNNASAFVGKTVDKISNNFSIVHNSVFDKLIKNLIPVYERLMKSFYKHTVVVSSFESFYQLANKAIFLFVLIYSIQLIIDGEASYGVAIAMLSYINLATSPVDKFKQVITMLASTDISISRLDRIENLIENHSNYDKLFLPQTKLTNLEIKDLSFSYDHEKSKKYNNINFKVQNCLALVGVSGEGKSTILNLLLGEENINRGSISLDKLDLNFLPYGFRNLIFNVYSQNIEIFNNDLNFNLTLGREIILQKDQQAILAQLNKDLANFLSKLEKVIDKGYKNILNLIISEEKFRILFDITGIIAKEELSKQAISGYIKFLKNIVASKDKYLEILTKIEFNRSFIIREKIGRVIQKLNLNLLKDRDFGENGVNISGGERQKIMFARFLLKENWDFFILDEPFTNLDSIAEKEMIELLSEFIQDKSGILISHKFNIIKKLSQQIVFLENGTVANIGSHEELLASNKKYFELHQTYYQNNQ